MFTAILNFLFFSVCCKLTLGLSNASNPVITLPDGQIQGRLIQGLYSNYYGFQGIPFAEPPLGDLRFQAPQPVKPWSNVLNATSSAPTCLSTALPGSEWTETGADNEDCLYLNVYTPTLNVTADLPVMVYIYGGKFAVVATPGGPDYLIAENVILVYINYRVGALGFLSTGDHVIPGNAGLKDQVLALKWVKKNIKQFGGDPEKITIFGQSAGGGSVGLHLISEQSKGLFRAAIFQSGSALMNDTVQENPKNFAIMLAKKLNHYSNNSEELLQLFKNATSKEIMDGAVSLFGQSIYVFPVLEVESDGAFLTKPHYDLIASGAVSRVPVIAGNVEQESLISYSSKEQVELAAKKYDADPTLLIPGNFRAKANISREELGLAAKAIYVKDGDSFANNLVQVLNFESDTTFCRPSIKQAKLHSRYAPVWFYEFSYSGSSESLIPGAGSVGHAAELNYLFYETFTPGPGRSLTGSAEDILTQNRMVKLWTNFAKYMDPLGVKDEKIFGNITWPTISESNFTILNINATLSLKDDFKQLVVPKWDQYFNDYGLKPFVTY